MENKKKEEDEVVFKPGFLKRLFPEDKKKREEDLKKWRQKIKIQPVDNSPIDN
jgi:hypothetical protein